MEKLEKEVNILVANNHLFNVGGSETFTYSLIEELVKREDINEANVIQGKRNR